MVTRSGVKPGRLPDELLSEGISAFGAAHQRPQVFQVVVDKYLAGRPLDSGGLSNVATVLIELNEECEVFEPGLIEDLHAFAEPGGHESAPLDASGARRGRIDHRWNLRLNTELEPDL